MNILFNGSPAVRPVTGAGTYAKELIAHLLSIDNDNTYKVFYIKSPLENARDLFYGSRKNVSYFSFSFPYRFLNIFWNNFKLFPIETIFRGIDIAHSLDKIAPFTVKAKTVITIHDMLWHADENGRPKRKGLVYKQILESIARANAIITDSEFSKNELVRYLPFVSDKVHVINLGVSERFRPIARTDMPGEIHKRYPWDGYVLYLGALNDPRKNVRLIVDSYAYLKKSKKIKEKLVLCGTVWRYSADELLKHIKRLKLPDDILIYSKWIPDEDIPYIYNKARIVLFPSLYEGFGLPVLESMACGKPVITSNISPMKEIASDAAITINPRDGKALADSIENLLSDNMLYEKMAERGLKRAKDFTWIKTAQETLKVYEKCRAS